MKPGEMSQRDWEVFLKQFRVPKHQGIYVLGCFARYQTLYSQQVRALNLIAAMCKTGALKDRCRVAVIGGGAAGLMAAAGAAFRGARVTVFEQLDGPMELQRNNRQRWLHPRIYDWPDPAWQNDKAELPLMTWSADYAESVALQIERYWKRLERELNIDAKWNVHVQLPASDAEITLVAASDEGCQRHSFDVAILAIGFGLEPEAHGQYSYWDEDDIDGSFRKPVDKKRKWLISGCGDGGLTDLMRLCLRRFRHEEIARLFATAPGIDEAIKELGRIHSHAKANDARFLSDKYEKLEVEGWSKLLRDRLRQRESEIWWAAKSPFYYGPGASVLNRLIVSQLFRIGAFKYRVGPTGKVARKAKGDYLVPFADGTKERFDRVLLRYGPKPTALQTSFPNISKACTKAAEAWRRLNRDEDQSIKKLWDVNFFGPETAPPLIDDSKSDASFVSLAECLGVRARVLNVSKEIRSDGSSSLTYRIEGLVVTKAELELQGLRFHFLSSAGHVEQPELDVEQPELDESANRLGITWEEEDSPNGPPRELGQVREKVRQLHGILRFPNRLKKGDQPVNFGLTVKLLNGDALSKWQFDHLYDEEDRTHVNGEPLGQLAPIEYFARVVWFPVDSLQIRLTLPDGLATAPSVSVFRSPLSDNIPIDEVVRTSILESFPPKTSRWSPTDAQNRWIRSTDDQLPPHSLIEISPRTWKLSVHKPPIGSCFSLDWLLPVYDGDAEFQRLETEAESIRREFLRQGDDRRDGKDGDPRIRFEFARLYEQIRSLLKPKKNEGFEVSLMVYDQAKRRLVVSEGLIDGVDFSHEMLTFWLPFGLGLAGACFKEGERAFLYKRPDGPSAAHEYYLPLPNNDSHQILLAVPIDHPQFGVYMAKTPSAKLPERARQCIGVVDIGSRSKNSRMWKLLTAKKGVVETLRNVCQEFCDRVVSSRQENA